MVLEVLAQDARIRFFERSFEGQFVCSSLFKNLANALKHELEEIQFISNFPMQVLKSLTVTL